MPLTAANLLPPTGEIEVGFFPEEDLTSVMARLTAYLTEGYAKASVTLPAGTERDNAAAAWAYYRSYKAIYTGLLAKPSTVQVDREGSASYLLTQITRFQDLAREKLNEFIELAPDEDEAASVPPLASSSTSLVFSW